MVARHTGVWMHAEGADSDTPELWSLRSQPVQTEAAFERLARLMKDVWSSAQLYGQP